MFLYFQPDVIEREIRFPVTSVPARETTYFCMTFELPDDEEYHLVASEPILDNRQVMHHIILSGCDEAEDGNGLLHPIYNKTSSTSTSSQTYRSMTTCSYVNV